MIRAALVLAAAALTAALVNFALLQQAAGGSDRVGHLQPRIRMPTAPAPRWTVRPARGPVEDAGADD
jgi:hypothetical protein